MRFGCSWSSCLRQPQQALAPTVRALRRSASLIVSRILYAVMLADHLSRGREREFLEDVVRTGFWHSSVTEDPYVQRHPDAGSLRTYASLADSACIQANVTASEPAPDGVYGPAVALGQDFSNARAPCAASSRPLTPDSDFDGTAVAHFVRHSNRPRIFYQQTSTFSVV